METQLCPHPRGIRHRTHVNNARSMNLRMRCMMSGAVARGLIYAMGMYVLGNKDGNATVFHSDVYAITRMPTTQYQ